MSVLMIGSTNELMNPDTVNEKIMFMIACLLSQLIILHYCIRQFATMINLSAILHMFH